MSLTAAGTRRRRALGSGFRGPRGWPRPCAGAPGTATSLCTGRSRACARPSRESAQGLASRRSAAGGGPGAQVDARLPRPLPESGVERGGQLRQGQGLGWAEGAEGGQGRGPAVKGEGMAGCAWRRQRRARVSGRRGAREGPLTQPGCSRARILSGLRLRAAFAGSSAGASLPRPHSSPPDGCRWPAPGFVVAPTQMHSETKSRCSYLALQEAVGERRSAIWSPRKRPGVGSRRWQGTYGGLGQETNI